MRPVASALCAVLLLAACAADAPSPSHTARSSIPPGLEQIADSYLDLAAPFNTATCRFNVVLSQQAPALAELKLASADYAATLTTLIGGLQAIEWPAENGISRDADDLVSALVATLTYASVMAEAASMSKFIEADNQLIAANLTSAAAATQLRADLGLGGSGNPCTTQPLLDQLDSAGWMLRVTPRMTEAPMTIQLNTYGTLSAMRPAFMIAVS